MANLAALKLDKEVIKHDVATLDELPAQMGMRTPTLQPGPYVFQLPPLTALREAFDVVNREGKPQRIVAIFNEDAPLLIVQTPPEYKDLIGKPFRNRISNVERKRGAADSNAPSVSDMDYLLQALGEKALPTSNEAYINTLLKHAGKTFGASVELSYYCNEKKPVRVDGADGTTVVLDGEEGREKRLGCRTRFYQKDITRDPETGRYPNSVTCDCEAVLYANENLGQFRKVNQAAGAAAAPKG